jgi:hypothetical protein
MPLKGGSSCGIEGKNVNRNVSLEGCSIATRSKNAFDPSNPAGAYVINCGSDYGQSIMLTIVEMVRCLYLISNAPLRHLMKQPVSHFA